MKRLHLATPWAHAATAYCAPRRLIVKLALGEAPDAVPSGRDVRRGRARPVSSLDGGAVDRVLRHFAGTVQVTRVHTPARRLGQRSSARAAFDDLEHAIGLSRLFQIQGTDQFNVTDAVDALRQIGQVEAATPVYLSTLPFRETDDRLFAPDRAWSTRDQINAAQALAYEPGDPTVIVGVIDTGVASHHPELCDRLRPGFDTVEIGDEDLAMGLTLLGDETDPDPEPEDEVGHGTSCAAIIGAKGERLPPGLAGLCSLVPLRVLGAAQVTGREEPIGIGAIPDIDHGFKMAVDLGARVLNLSFGTPLASLAEGDPIPHEDVVRYALARGCVLVAASGNSGKAEAFSPAALEGVIAVGALDAEDRPTNFTTRGEHVALCAPGERVVTASLQDYQLATGTSFAAPFVTATAALMVSRSLRRSTPMDGCVVRQLLIESARPHGRGAGDGVGAGNLDAQAALQAVDRWVDQQETELQPKNAERTMKPNRPGAV